MKWEFRGESFKWWRFSEFELVWFEEGVVELNLWRWKKKLLVWE